MTAAVVLLGSLLLASIAAARGVEGRDVEGRDAEDSDSFDESKPLEERPGAEHEFREADASETDRAERTLEHILYTPGENRFDLLPLTHYLNTAFDTAQVSLAFSQDDYWRNHERVINRIVSPRSSTAKDGGYDEFFRQEFLSPQVLPNITLHLLGNGYDFRLLAEWYDDHGIRHPYLWAFLSSYAGYLGNEAIESSNSEINASDHIADLYFFNLVGNFMFMSDAIARMAHDQMQLRNWTGQPFFDARHQQILNASNNYVMRPVLWGEKVRPFVYFGLHYFAGLSTRLPDRSELSFGAGLATRDPLNQDVDDFADNLKKVRVSGGIFWDKDDRLLASMIFNGTNSFLVRANLYPDLFRNRNLDLGFFVGLSRDGAPSIGVIIRKFMAVGFR